MNPKVIIGGLGGSGTRVPAKIFQAMGLLVKTDINASLDWMPFTRVKDRLREKTPKFMMLKELDPDNAVFKEPHTANMIVDCFKAWPEVKFIYVERHGLEQSIKDGRHWQYDEYAIPLNSNKFVRPHKGECSTPAQRMDWWILMHKLMKAYSYVYPIYWLSLNRLIADPAEEITKMVKWCGFDLNPSTFTIPTPPPSLGRHKGHEPLFRKDQLDFLVSAGYDL